MEVKSRHHLREDEENKIKQELKDLVEENLDEYNLENIELDEDYDIVLADGEPLIMRLDNTYFVTLKGVLELGVRKNRVTVDAGAVEFVINGADIMRPGIVEADNEIEESDLIVVIDENHSKPLAIGRALTQGDDMLGDEGKVVENLHHVGDELWEFEP